MNDRQTFSVLEAGLILGIGRGLAYQMAKDGRLPTIKLGHRILVPKKAFYEHFQELFDKADREVFPEGERGPAWKSRVTAMDIRGRQPGDPDYGDPRPILGRDPSELQATDPTSEVLIAVGALKEALEHGREAENQLLENLLASQIELAKVIGGVLTELRDLARKEGVN